MSRSSPWAVPTSPRKPVLQLSRPTKLTLLAGLLGLLLGLSNVAQRIEQPLYDLRQLVARFYRPAPLHSELVLVGLDRRATAAGLKEEHLEELAEVLPRALLVEPNFEAIADDDGVVRSFALATRENRGWQPVSLLRTLAGKRQIEFATRGIRVDELWIPTDDEYRFYPLFHDTEKTTLPNRVMTLVPASLLDAVEMPLDDRLVLLGNYDHFAAAGEFATPTGPMVELELAGVVADSLLTGQGWRPLSPWLWLPWTLALLAGLSLTLSGRRPVEAAGRVCFWLVIWFVLHLELAGHGYFFSMAGGLVGAASLSLCHLGLQLPRAQRLVNAFGSRPQPVPSQQTVATVMFTQLPQHLLELERDQDQRAIRRRQQYAALLGDLCDQYGGNLLDQQGDAQMIAFGLDEPCPAHALRASATALGLVEKLPELEQAWGLEEPQGAHCGLCTGEVAWGEVGATGLRAAAAIGDTTNTAARLMGAAMKSGVRVLLAESTYQAAQPRLYAEALEPLNLKGKSEPVAVYEAKELHLLPPPPAAPPKPATSKGQVGVILGLLFWGLTAAHMVGPLETLAPWLWDLPLRSQPEPKARVIVAGIDDESLRFAKWPWPRSWHALALKNCEAAGAGCFFLDVLMEEPSETKEDAALAEAVVSSNIVVLAAAASHDQHNFFEPRLAPGLEPRALMQAGKLGLVHHAFDSDGVQRSLPHLYTELEPPYPSAALAIAGRWSGRGWSRHGKSPLLGEQRLPEQTMGRWQPSRHLQISYHRLLDPSDPIFEKMKGALVVVGDKLEGDGDLFLTPLGPLKGVEIHAVMASTLAAPNPPGDYRHHAGWILWALPLGACLAWACVKSHGPGRLTLLLAVGLAVVALLHFLLLQRGVVGGGQPFTMVLVIVLSAVALHTAAAIEGVRRFVPDAILEELVGSGSIADRTLEATVLVTDIRGYTTLSEGRKPVEVLELLNQYHEATVACYERYGGNALTYQGDAQLVVFGAVRTLANPQLQAVRAAQELQTIVAELRRRWQLHEAQPFEVGAGLCTGEVTVGLLKAGERQQYTVVGETVRRAHKLQSQSDLLGRSVLMDGRTMELCCGALSLERLAEDVFAPREISPVHKGTAGSHQS